MSGISAISVDQLVMLYAGAPGNELKIEFIEALKIYHNSSGGHNFILFLVTFTKQYHERVIST